MPSARDTFEPKRLDRFATNVTDGLLDGIARVDLDSNRRVQPSRFRVSSSSNSIWIC